MLDLSLAEVLSWWTFFALGECSIVVRAFPAAPRKSPKAKGRLNSTELDEKTRSTCSVHFQLGLNNRVQPLTRSDLVTLTCLLRYATISLPNQERRIIQNAVVLLRIKAHQINLKNAIFLCSCFRGSFEWPRFDVLSDLFAFYLPSCELSTTRQSYLSVPP